MHRRKLAIWLVVGVCVWLSWRACGTSTPERDDGDEAASDPTADRSASRARGQIVQPAAGRRSAISLPRRDGEVAIRGTVIDDATRTPVGGVEIVFRGALGEETVIAGADGRYEVMLSSGTYRAFVRDDRMLSVTARGRDRLTGPPSADSIAEPVELAMPIVVAQRDLEHVDLPVLRSGIITGRVIDTAGRPLAHAVVRALGTMRPALGTDVTETDAAGRYELRVPRGGYVLDATHPRFAGLEEAAALQVTAGHTTELDLRLVAGCVITGRVIAADGTPVTAGAIETAWGDDGDTFLVSSQIAADGTFRWVETREGEVRMHAWPWKSAHSENRQFTCKAGARHASVVFQIPARAADIDGILADASGEPVAFAYIDLQPLDPGGLTQQERTDAEGRWGVFHMPPGRYVVTAYAQGRGAVTRTITAPVHDVALALGGTGTLRGTVDLPDGSFSLMLNQCTGPEGGPVLDEHRLVNVSGGAFEVEHVPACALTFTASAGPMTQIAEVVVPANGVGTTELALAPPPAVHLEGIVRGPDGRPLAGTSVFAVTEELAGQDSDGIDDSVKTDEAGRYAIDTHGGATVVFSNGTYEHTVKLERKPPRTLDVQFDVPPPPPEEEPPSEDLEW
jgi:hypothetical protein